MKNCFGRSGGRLREGRPNPCGRVGRAPLASFVVSERLSRDDVAKVAYLRYGLALGVGLSVVAGKLFRIGHLGMLTEPMMLSGLATAEMCMADLGWPVRLGSGVAAAQAFYRKGPEAARAAA